MFHAHFFSALVGIVSLLTPSALRYVVPGYTFALYVLVVACGFEPSHGDPYVGDGATLCLIRGWTHFGS